jgi:hypothetical protein
VYVIAFLVCIATLQIAVSVDFPALWANWYLYRGQSFNMLSLMYLSTDFSIIFNKEDNRLIS